MWVTKLVISQVKKRIFCPKTTKFGPKLAFLVDMGQVMQVFSVPCWWVGWWLWHAGRISQDTYLLYLSDILVNNKHISATCNYCNRVGCMCTELVTGGMGEIVLQITTKD